MAGNASKLKFEMLEMTRWHYLTNDRPSYRSLGGALGVDHAQVIRWRARGEADKLRGKYTLFARFATELTTCQSIDADRRKAAKAAQGASGRPAGGTVTPDMQKFFTECDDDDFLMGLAEWPPRSEAPAGLTYAHWPPKTLKEFQRAKRAAWESKNIPDQEWWVGVYASDPAEWVPAGEAGARAHERWRFITPGGGGSGRYRGEMEVPLEATED